MNYSSDDDSPLSEYQYTRLSLRHFFSLSPAAQCGRTAHRKDHSEFGPPSEKPSTVKSCKIENRDGVKASKWNYIIDI